MNYFVGEFSGKHHREWFPSFNQALYENYLRENLNTKIAKYKHVKGDMRVFEIDELDYDVVCTGNSNFFIDLDKKKVVCFNTYYNHRRLVAENIRLFEDFDVSFYCGHYYEKDIKEVRRIIERGSRFTNEYKFLPWVFRPLHWILPSYEYNPKNKFLFFKGLYIPKHRDFLNIIKSKNISDIKINEGGRLPFENYHSTCAESLVCLSAPGVKDMCNRDIELFSMGVPTLRTKFFSELLHVEIPDDVYIPVEFEQRRLKPYGMPSDHEKLAEDMINKWNDIKKDEDYLLKVGKRAKEFYNEFFTNEKLMEFTFTILKQEL